MSSAFNPTPTTEVPVARRRYTRVAAIVAGVLAISSALGAGIASSSDSTSIAHTERKVTAERRAADAAGWGQAGAILIQKADEHAAQVEAERQAFIAAAEYAAAVQRAQLEQFYAAVAAAEAARARRPAAPTTRGGGGGGGGGSVGGACGGATNGADRFIQAESSGNPNARNPSGAFGCYQIMPGTWAGSCSDLGQLEGSSTQAQAACASRLPSSSWAATGG